MIGGSSIGGKREGLARALLSSGLASLLERLHARDSLLVLSYHRIGNSSNDLFDSGVFSATAEELDEQVAYLKNTFSIVTPEEAIAFIDGSTQEITRRCRVLFTFDDGYLDNYKIAYPILRSHGVQGVFFLSTGIVGSCNIPWWDQIAYRIKTAHKRQFTLHYPTNYSIDIDKNGAEKSIQTILKFYKMPINQDSARFMRELAEAAEGEEPPRNLRRFLDWNEARKMIAGGMTIGSHAHSHQILSRMTAEMQQEELSKSRVILNQKLGIDVQALAYPVGHRDSFSELTQTLAQASGYRCAFSHHGGANIQGNISPFDVKRAKIHGQGSLLLRARTAVVRATGSYWP